MWENSTKPPDDVPLVCLGQITGTKLTTGSVRGSSANSIPNCKDDKHGENMFVFRILKSSVVMGFLALLSSPVLGNQLQHCI